ncbi:MAG: hypothetical protein WC976_06660 [Caldisericia bacterium]
MPKRKFVVVTDAGYTQLPYKSLGGGAEPVTVENLQVLFAGEAVNSTDALIQCRNNWAGYDLQSTKLTVYEVVSEESEEF